MFGNAKDILSEFRRIYPENFYAANFPPGNFLYSWLLINSRKVKHEISRNILLVLYTVQSVFLMCFR